MARVCDAVEHAHERGIIHRDLKPGNVLVDDSGQPKVLDFGVARATDLDVRATTGHTEVGELIGTLAYMSPEQMAADPAVLDRRSDVYTLGVILFELLAERLPYALVHLPLTEVARVIREQQPVRLGALDARLRGDVETIVAKALEKDPPRRYLTAAELAADIRRHLRHEPIRARPPSALYQLSKFARRHKALVLTTAGFLILLLGAGAVTAWQAIQLARAERDQAVQQAHRSQQVHDALGRAVRLREEARTGRGGADGWAEALAEARRAEALAGEGPLEPGLAEEVAYLVRELDEEGKDRRLVAELDAIRMRQAEVKEEQFDMRAASPLYAAAFRRYGIDVEALSPEEAARRVRESRVREALLAALDNWGYWSEAKEDRPGREKLWAVADGADDNHWRRTLREAARSKDAARLQWLATDPRSLEQPRPALALLGQTLQHLGLVNQAVDFLRRAQERHPDDFWLNHQTGYTLMELLRPPRPDAALAYFRAAVALRPDSPGAHLNVGVALSAQGDPAAAACFRRAAELAPDYAPAHAYLGDALWKQRDLAGAAAAYRRAIELSPKNSLTQFRFGFVLRELDDFTGAAAHFRRAFELNPKESMACYNLGWILHHQGDLPGAAEWYRRALTIAPDHAESHCNLGHVLKQQGKFHDALAELRTGHDLGSRRKDWPYDTPGWIKQCERLLEFDARLPALLKGEVRPADAAERIEWATLCGYKGLHAAAVRFYKEAFDADAKLADDFRSGRRSQAAFDAALAGCGKGEDAPRPDGTERPRLRGLALDWLRADLAAWIKHLQESSPPDRPAVQRVLLSWQRDVALAGVREADSLGRLPAAERARWNDLWADIAATLAKARETK
jgi:tetratricopeptide (TPR) repeat protein